MADHRQFDRAGLTPITRMPVVRNFREHLILQHLTSLMRHSRLALFVFPFVLPALLQAQAPTPAPAIAIVPVPESKLPLKHAPQPTTAAISAADLMTRLYIFADDSMQGREAGTIGNFKGTEYIAAEAKRLGLVPAGENGGYFQTIPFKTRAMESSSHIKVGETALSAGKDWAVAYGSKLPSGTVPVVYGGTFGDDSPRLTAEQATGKLVVYRVLPSGMAAVQSPASYPANTAGVMLVGLDPAIPMYSRPTTILDDPANEGASPLPTLMLLSQAGATAMFPSALTELRAGAEGRPATMNLSLKLEPVPFAARNVVAILPGSDAKLKGQYVAVGAHNDHIGFNGRPVDHDSTRIYNHIVRPGGAEDMGKRASPDQQTQVNGLLAAYRTAHPGMARLDSISNGADDDGSGSVSVLEIAEQMSSMKTKPKRSVLFVWHVGEEKGLLGSRYYTDHPTVPRDSIVAQLNIDMVGRGDAWDVTGSDKDGAPLRGNANYLQAVGSRRLSTELGDLVEQVNKDGKHAFVIDYSMDTNGHPQNIYCRSDHYEYARYGIPIAFFTTGGHSDYHQVTDEPQYIDYDHMARVDSLISDIALHVANLDHRVVVDHPKPDPKGSCKQ